MLITRKNDNRNTYGIEKSLFKKSVVFNLLFVKRLRAQTKSYTEHSYSLVVMALVKWYHPLELLRHLYSEEPELDPRHCLFC